MSGGEAEKPVAEMSFEEAMAALEAVVDRLESGSVPLEDSIALYERGAELRRHCEDKLRAAEEKIARITFGPDGKPSGTEPVDPG
ncbi:MAG: exodeoxyribonuclease VII small subunit [Alphaproteobacteria bacterium]|nr:MAG: exodeoxyribonuclease VII small subunit [Alphaproteobacteria bacterium]